MLFDADLEGEISPKIGTNEKPSTSDDSAVLRPRRLRRITDKFDDGAPVSSRLALPLGSLHSCASNGNGGNASAKETFAVPTSATHPLKPCSTSVPLAPIFRPREKKPEAPSHAEPLVTNSDRPLAPLFLSKKARREKLERDRVDSLALDVQKRSQLDLEFSNGLHPHPFLMARPRQDSKPAEEKAEQEWVSACFVDVPTGHAVFPPSAALRQPTPADAPPLEMNISRVQHRSIIPGRSIRAAVREWGRHPPPTPSLEVAAPVILPPPPFLQDVSAHRWLDFVADRRLWEEYCSALGTADQTQVALVACPLSR
jgi:hypothetical protein